MSNYNNNHTKKIKIVKFNHIQFELKSKILLLFKYS